MSEFDAINIFYRLYAFCMIFVDIWLIKGLKYLFDKFAHMHMFYDLNKFVDCLICLWTCFYVFWLIIPLFDTSRVFSLHKSSLDPSNFEMLEFVIYVHLYHIYLNISNLLEVVSMHKHCLNHFCILGFRMSIVVFIEKFYKLCFKTIFDPNFYSHQTKMMFFTYSNENESHVSISFYTTLHSLTFEFDFDFCLTFSWIFFCFGIFLDIKVCITNTSLIIFSNATFIQIHFFFVFHCWNMRKLFLMLEFISIIMSLLV